MAQEWLWIIAKRKMRGALPREDGDLLREYHAIDEDDFLSSWLREDVEGKEAKKERLNKEAEEEKSQKWEKRCGGRKGRVDILVESGWIVCPAKCSSPYVRFLRWRVVVNSFVFFWCVSLLRLRLCLL